MAKVDLTTCKAGDKGMSEQAPPTKERIRAALDVLENYTGPDGKINATALTQEITHLRKENERLRQQVAELEEDRKVMIQSLETQGDRIAALSAAVIELTRQRDKYMGDAANLASRFDERGERMNRLKHLCETLMYRQPVTPGVWTEVLGWFENGDDLK